jgi:hypothetical protein
MANVGLHLAAQGLAQRRSALGVVAPALEQRVQRFGAEVKPLLKTNSLERERWILMATAC